MIIQLPAASPATAPAQFSGWSFCEVAWRSSCVTSCTFGFRRAVHTRRVFRVDVLGGSGSKVLDAVSHI
eukprot:1373369-Pyramimonas_sp.AAC.1